MPDYTVIPYTEAIQQLRDKISLDSDRWDDISDDEYQAFFVVAGAKGSILADIRDVLERALEEGWSLDRFAQAFEVVTQRWVTMKGDKDWRMRTIFFTNLSATYAQGRYEYQLDPEVVKIQPYLQYNHSDNASPRPAHLALDGQIFRAGEMPFYPPNGYGCGCWARSLTPRQFERLGGNLSQIQRGDLVDATLPDGRKFAARIEPDPGWDYDPTTPRRERIDRAMADVLGRLPEDVRVQVEAEMEGR